MATLRGFEFPDALHYLMEHDTGARLDGDGCRRVRLLRLRAWLVSDAGRRDKRIHEP